MRVRSIGITCWRMDFSFWPLSTHPHSCLLNSSSRPLFSELAIFSLPLSLSLFFSLSLSLSLSHTHTHTHTLSLSLSLYLTLTLTLTLFLPSLKDLVDGYLISFLLGPLLNILACVLLLHAWGNFTSELTRFADREFHSVSTCSLFFRTTTKNTFFPLGLVEQWELCYLLS